MLGFLVVGNQCCDQISNLTERKTYIWSPTPGHSPPDQRSKVHPGILWTIFDLGILRILMLSSVSSSSTTILEEVGNNRLYPGKLSVVPLLLERLWVDDRKKEDEGREEGRKMRKKRLERRQETRWSHQTLILESHAFWCLLSSFLSLSMRAR